MVKTCQCCGHPMPDDAVSAGLPPIQRRIFDALKRSGRRGLTRDEVMDKVYCNVPGGGASSMTTINVHKKRMLPKLAEHGLTIISTSPRGAGTFWRLESIERQQL